MRVCIHTKEKQHTHLTRDGKLKQTEQVEDLRSKFEEQAREMENRYQVVEVVEVVVEVLVAEVVVVVEVEVEVDVEVVVVVEAEVDVGAGIFTVRKRICQR